MDKQHRSRNSKVLYSPHTTPARVVSPSSANNNMSGEDIVKYMKIISNKPLDEKLKFTAILTPDQLKAWSNAMNNRAPLSSSARTAHLSHLSDKALDEYEESLYSQGSGKRNKKRSTRHKKKRGKKTRKY